MQSTSGSAREDYHATPSDGVDAVAAVQSTEEYDLDSNTDTWLGEIPERRDARPPLRWHPIPHRWLVQVPDDAMKKLQVLFDSTGKKNSTLVEYHVSPHEGHVYGIHIHSSISPLHDVGRVFFLAISYPRPFPACRACPQDCKQVIEKGWGEWHTFSDARSVISLPKEYLMIYGPRDDEAIECAVY
ncbi:uncharacterized protein ARMOST_22244 [Armillaria ostoyae]|uniref:Luciferase domain-containing protein n=1 Tax=Armillaria ostoyae TaxID=47428 RepID=A0A284SCB6_ARMOS|nr:uncharacterized protein ARMOST_22244 [Armillaria ostoyae]